MTETVRYYKTGKRKSAIARVWLMPGTGNITVNRRPFEVYFPLEAHKRTIQEPLNLTNTLGQYDILVSVHGGGVTGQAGAIRHGITRALVLANPELRLMLKKAGFIKRDPRIKERKKYGQKGARARFQFSKR